MKCIFLGFKVGVKGYKLWCPELKKVIISRDVIFDETAMLHDLSSTITSDKTQQEPSVQVEVDINADSTPKPTSQPVTTSQQPQYSIAKDRPRREVRPPQRYAEADLVAYALNAVDMLTKTISIAKFEHCLNLVSVGC